MCLCQRVSLQFAVIQGGGGGMYVNIRIRRHQHTRAQARGATPELRRVVPRALGSCRAWSIRSLQPAAELRYRYTGVGLSLTLTSNLAIFCLVPCLWPVGRRSCFFVHRVQSFPSLLHGSMCSFPFWDCGTVMKPSWNQYCLQCVQQSTVQSSE